MANERYFVNYTSHGHILDICGNQINLLCAATKQMFELLVFVGLGRVLLKLLVRSDRCRETIAEKVCGL
jgi:hypothetical protein